MRLGITPLAALAVGASLIFGCAAGGGAPAAGNAAGSAAMSLEEKSALGRFYLGLGDIYRTDLNDTDKALVCYLKYLELFPVGREADEVRARVMALEASSSPVPRGSPEASAFGIPPAKPPVSAPLAVPVREVPLKDHYGKEISIARPDSAGTVIIFLKTITSRNLELLAIFAGYPPEANRRALTIIISSPSGSVTAADYLRSKGIPFPLINDDEGAASGRWGITEYPSVVFLNSGGRLLRRLDKWDGSGLEKMIAETYAAP